MEDVFNQLPGSPDYTICGHTFAIKQTIFFVFCNKTKFCPSYHFKHSDLKVRIKTWKRFFT
jgi:hypothetical protein